MKSANSSRKMPIVVHRKVMFLKIRMSGCTLAFRAGGRRDLIRKFDAAQRVNDRKARMRTAHPQPTRSNRLLSMRGKMMPPIEPPVEAIPVANARLRLKK